MPVTANDYLKKLRFVIDKIPSETENIIFKNEKEITQLNIKQITDDHKGYDGLFLKNTDPRYRGFYTKYTASINPSKTEGELYTFFDTGDFLGNFFVDVLPDKKFFEIDSTGTGTGEKAAFFAGYTNLFGLTDDNKTIANWGIIYPDLMKFLKQYL